MAELPFDQLIFDLDDTLLDTYRQLVPRASRDACQAMIKAGLNSSIERCLAAWEEHGSHHSRREIFPHLVGCFGVREGADPKSVATRGHHAFYNRRVETDISLFPGAREMLLDLHERYPLHLVTQGVQSTQEEKIRILDIANLFQSISHVDPAQGANKRTAFAEISRRSGARPERHLSIGNRVDTDIAEARVLGWRGCWVRYGEHAAMLPSNALEQPEFTIENIVELSKRCRL